MWVFRLPWSCSETGPENLPVSLSRLLWRYELYPSYTREVIDSWLLILLRNLLSWDTITYLEPQRTQFHYKAPLKRFQFDLPNAGTASTQRFIKPGSDTVQKRFPFLKAAPLLYAHGPVTQPHRCAPPPLLRGTRSPQGEDGPCAH